MTWQDALWAIPNWCGRWWDLVVGAIALATAVTLFLKMILGHRFGALLVSRALGGTGLLGVFASTLNSGWLKWSIALLVLGMASSTTLIATNWCNRKDQSLTIPRAIWRLAGAALTWVCGPYRPYDPTEEIKHE